MSDQFIEGFCLALNVCSPWKAFGVGLILLFTFLLVASCRKENRK